jgi:kynurenine formamidase
MFTIDWNKYRLIDLSYEVISPGSEERPFKVERSFLPDRAYKHQVLTHSHVGTHVEAASHFYEGGRDINEYPIEAFMGRGILFETEPGMVTQEGIEKSIGDLIQPGDIVICRNKAMSPENFSYLTPESARWLAVKRIKMVGIDCNFELGKDIEETRLVHDILMSQGVTFIEFLDHLDLITRKEFFFIALPYKVKLDSSWTRAIAIEEVP